MPATKVGTRGSRQIGKSHVLYQFVPKIREQMAKGAQAVEIVKSLKDEGILVSVKAVLDAAHGETYKDLPGALPKEKTRGPFTIAPSEVMSIRKMYDESGLALEDIASKQGRSISWVTRIATRQVRQDVPDVNPNHEKRQHRYDDDTVRAILDRALPFVGKRGRWAAWDKVGEEFGCTSVYIYYLITEQRRKDVVQDHQEEKAS